MKRITVFVLLIALVLGFGVTSGYAAVKTDKTVIEGGQNQVAGYSGKQGVMLFNKTTRFKVESYAMYEGTGPNKEKIELNKKLLVIKVQIKNAQKFPVTVAGPFQYMEVLDADDNLGGTLKSVKANNYLIPEGGIKLIPAAGTKAVFAKPVDKDFVPARIIFNPGGGKPVFRVDLIQEKTVKE